MMAVEALLCLVIAVTDGDSIKVRCDQQAEPVNLTIRMAEIDAPEKKQAFGERAKQALSDLCFNERAKVTPEKLDFRKRTIARVECKGKDANREMVRLGMAWAYIKYQTDQLFPQLELRARAQGVGLWADLGTDAPPTPPWKWRRAAKL
ncbi:MAG: thermonuclease family protein [Burkholderiaceae bacterium]|nr:thermonuclease family protein [Burkholderiaceae bacterium]